MAAPIWGAMIDSICIELQTQVVVGIIVCYYCLLDDKLELNVTMCPFKMSLLAFL